MNNLSPLFQPASQERSYLQTLTLSREDREILIHARDTVRKALREGLPVLIRRHFPTIAVVEKPRFVTQGSYAYATINRHCHPGQQIDMDDGCYLPMSFAKEFEVGYASNLFFAAVEAILEPLAKTYGWTLAKDKPTCTRLVLNSTMHLDVPLYAIPDQEFKKLNEARAMEFSAALKGGTTDQAPKPLEWADLPANKVLLAMRDGSWKPSDPRPIIVWARYQRDSKGEQWVRTIRYLKAWRDFQWPKGGPTSICLMAAMDSVFRRAQERDDLMLLEVLERLPAVFEGPVFNPAEPDKKEDLAERLDKDSVRFEVISKLKAFASDLRRAIHNSLATEEACKLVRRHLGDRFPFEPTWIKLITAAEVVRSTPARQAHQAPGFSATTRSGQTTTRSG